MLASLTVLNFIVPEAKPGSSGISRFVIPFSAGRVLSAAGYGGGDAIGRLDDCRRRIRERPVQFVPQKTPRASSHFGT